MEATLHMIHMVLSSPSEKPSCRNHRSFPIVSGTGLLPLTLASGFCSRLTEEAARSEETGSHEDRLPLSLC